MTATNEAPVLDVRGEICPYPMLRTTRGDDIGAACGQLTGNVIDRTRRRERYLARSEAA